MSDFPSREARERWGELNPLPSVRREMLTSPEPWVRQGALFGIRPSDAPKYRTELEALLDDPDPVVCEGAILWSRFAFGDSPELRRHAFRLVCSNRGDRIRSSAALLLLHEPDSEVLDTLFELSEDAGEKLARTIVHGFARSSDVRTAEVLQRQLCRAYWSVRFAAAEALVKSGSHDTELQAVLEALNDAEEAREREKLASQIWQLSQDVPDCETIKLDVRTVAELIQQCEAMAER